MLPLFDPDVVEAIIAVRKIAHYDVSEEDAAVFLRWHNFVTNPQPKYITAWRAVPKDEQRWYRWHMGGISDARSALADAHYHSSRLLELERQVMDAISKTLSKGLPNGTVVALSGTRKLDFEYQAFVLAYRRCLEYLAGGLGAFFKIQANSFRDFPHAMRLETRKERAPKVAAALADVHARHAGELAFVLQEGRKSVRNRIAHYEFVQAGCVNVTSRGNFFLAEGDDTLTSGAETSSPLSSVLSQRLSLLQACMEDMIDTFIEAAKTHESG